MKFLVTVPPVITPSEPPSGAFLLAAGLSARGIEAGFLDLSLEYFRHIFSLSPEGRGYPAVMPAMDYLLNSPLYEPQQHRTASGILNSSMKLFSKKFPGWKISLMDLVPPESVHRPSEIVNICREGKTPFSEFWEEYLLPVLQRYDPENVLVSLSYLSQLTAGIDLVLFLRRAGYRVTVGGSLLNSLSRTGMGYELVRSVLPESSLGDGSSFQGFNSGNDPFLSRLSWPDMLEEWNYISGRPVIPYTLSTGCYWNRCLFCPDSSRKLAVYGHETFERFISTIPSTVMDKNPIIHFVDSAIPGRALEGVLPLLRQYRLDFYTFARPEGWISRLADRLNESGCLMLQLGAESGSRSLLDRFLKGIDPDTSLEAITNCARAGIRTYVYMLMGLPGETDNDIQASVRFLEKAGDSVDFINFSVFNLPVNCELTDRASEFGIDLLDHDSPDDSIRLYRPFIYNGLNPRIKARRAVSEYYSRIPSVAEALKRTPRWFRTSHFPLIEIPGRKSGISSDTSK
ncbi:MAG: radical SAM protein [Candidatus Aegiribacteria sp.]|nr:radical SAM protein [Candidatus Aegiribacteria sp.]